ncbi:hypothetical protein [Massilibacterium senegalense]|uniref:hypothetical protein n=1 Tax=Massilibacterium senegalense TaxID=1632858 RepID=UPI0007865F06|nr:hypothetical protein [Massilibacterium senegalense]
MVRGRYGILFEKYTYDDVLGLKLFNVLLTIRFAGWWCLQRVMQFSKTIVYLHFPILVANHTTYSHWNSSIFPYNELGGLVAIQGEIVDDVTLLEK